jgi:hypothetical protein
MIEVGGFTTRDCQGMSRRPFLAAACAAPFAWMADQANAEATSPKARSILLVWLGGGPSHLDLFDPKPKAPVEYRGPFATIPTRLPGVRFTELLPKLAARSNRFSLVRTNINFNGGHRPAGSIALTGSVAPDGGEDVGGKPGRYPPNVGSILARHRAAGALPAFISIARGPIGDGDGPVFGYGGGTWGQGHDPFMVACSEQGRIDAANLKLLDGLTPARLLDRRKVLTELDRLQRTMDQPTFRKWSATHQRAHSLLTSSGARQVFDLSRESAKTREAYGRTSFGQSCLLGRRLIESGVPYVQVNWSQYVEVFYPFSDYGWDTHADNFGLLADWHGPLLDGVFSALLDDLHERGLLKTTLVVCMGEFGRTPRINNIGSRDHWHHCYFSVWAGAGVKAGRVIGESDPRGERPATEPVTPAMVLTTVLELAGVASADRARLNVLDGGKAIDGLL